MSTAAARKVAVREPTPERGPCMRALPQRWQDAVDNLFLTNGDRTHALEMTGYNGTSRKGLNVTAHRIFADDRVRAAIREECAKRIDISEPELIAHTMDIMRNVGETARDRLNAISMIWSRANPVMTKHQVQVEHVLTDAERDIKHYRALQQIGAPRDAFLARFGANGIARVEALVLAEEARIKEIEAPAIEVEYEEAAAE
jgi:hypothetical protein